MHGEENMSEPLSQIWKSKNGGRGRKSGTLENSQTMYLRDSLQMRWDLLFFKSPNFFNHKENVCFHISAYKWNYHVHWQYFRKEFVIYRKFSRKENVFRSWICWVVLILPKLIQRILCYPSFSRIGKTSLSFTLMASLCF